MTGEDRIEIQDVIKGLWKFTTDEQMMSIMFAADHYDKAAVLRVVDAVAGKHEKPDCPVAKIRTALSKLPRPVAPVMPVYALAPSGHWLDKSYETSDYSEAQAYMRVTIGKVIPLYGWDDQPADFTLYADFGQFLQDRHLKIANMKRHNRSSVTLAPVTPEELGSEKLSDTDDNKGQDCVGSASTFQKHVSDVFKYADSKKMGAKI